MILHRCKRATQRTLNYCGRNGSSGGMALTWCRSWCATAQGGYLRGRHSHILFLRCHRDERKEDKTINAMDPFKGERKHQAADVERGCGYKANGLKSAVMSGQQVPKHPFSLVCLSERCRRLIFVQKQYLMRKMLCMKCADSQYLPQCA